VHPAPQHIFIIYADNNEKFYDPDLTVNLEYVKQFLFHIEEIISSNNEDVFNYVMSWIAHKIQRPDKKIETCLLLMSSEQGTGKSIFTEILNALTGDYLISTSIDKMSGQFNALYTRRTVIVLEELKKGLSNDTCDFLKDYITKVHEENEKNKTMLRVKNVSDIIICSSNEETINVNEFDRRYLITKLNPQMRGNHQYFDELKKYKDTSTTEFAHLYNYLLRYDISSFNPRAIPMTEVKQEMINEMEDSVKSFVRYVNEAIESKRILCWHECTGDRIGRSDLYQNYREYCILAGMNTNYIDTQNRIGRKMKKNYEMRKTKGLEYYQVKICDI
jgi:phage/plasmid-associated DNA primase